MPHSWARKGSPSPRTHHPGPTSTCHTVGTAASRSQPDWGRPGGHGTYAHSRERQGLAVGLLMLARLILGPGTPCTARGTASTFSLQTTCSQLTPQTPTACTPSPPLWMASRWRMSLWPSQTKPCPTEIVCQAGHPRGPPSWPQMPPRGQQEPPKPGCPDARKPAVGLPNATFPLIYRRFTLRPGGNGRSHLADPTEHRHPVSRKLRQGTRAPLVYAPGRGPTQDLRADHSTAPSSTPPGSQRRRQCPALDELCTPPVPISS